MRTLSGTLDAAQRATTSRPYVRVKVVLAAGGVERLVWTRVYTGSEPAYYHAACGSGNGALLRVRSVAGAVYQWQRDEAPGVESAWGTWTAGAIELGGVGVCALGNLAAIAGVSAAGDLVLVESADYGATWGAPAVVVAGVGVGELVAAAYRSPTMLGLFYTVAGQVRAIVRTAGVWGPAVAWPIVATTVTGLSVVWTGGDYGLVVTGTEATSARVWCPVFGGGTEVADGVWDAGVDLHEAAGGANVAFSCPSLGAADSLVGSADVRRAYWREVYSGTGAYSRIYWTHQPLAASTWLGGLWREPAPLPLPDAGGTLGGVDHAYGLASAAVAGSAWLSHPAGVWMATVGAAASTLDVTGNVVSVVASEGAGGGAARVELDNSGALYDTPGSGKLLPLRVGSEVTIEYGYSTSAGNEVPSGVVATRYTIERVGHVVEGGKARLVIEGRGMLALVEEWRARRPHVFAGGTKSVAELLEYLFARVGLGISQLGAASTPMSGLQPAWGIGPRPSTVGSGQWAAGSRRGPAREPSLEPVATVQLGLTGRAALARLLDQVPEVLWFRGGAAVVKQVATSDASVYSLGGTHPVVRAGYETARPEVNRWQVYGTGTYGEAFDWASIGSSYDFLEVVSEPELTTAGEASDRADAARRREVIHTPAGVLDVRPVVGAELYDVIEVTAARAGLSAATRRIIGLAWLYDRVKGQYQQRIYLGGV